MPLLVLVVLLVAAAPAHAQWSPPQRISKAGETVRPVSAFSPGGARMTAWVRFAGERPSVYASGIGRVARGADWLAGPVGFGQRRFALAWTGERQRRLFARTGRTYRVARGRRIASPVLAGSHDGLLALAWFDDRGTGGDAVRVALRRPGRRFGRPILLARGSVRSVSVAVGERGEVLVAWNEDGRVRTRLRRRGRFGPVDRIRSFQAFNARLQTAVAPTGRAVVGWTAKFRSEGGGGGHTYQQVAVRPSGGGRFRPAQLLSQTPDAPDVEGALRLDSDGSALAYTLEDGVYRSVAGASGTFPPAQRVAPRGAVLQDLAGGSAFWLAGRRLYADGEAISAPGAAQADAAVDPLTGLPSVVWVQDGAVMTSSRG